MEDVSVGQRVTGTAIRWEVQSTEGTWAVLVRPMYRMAKERHRVWQCHLDGTDVVSDVAVSMGRVKEEVDGVDAKLARMGIEEGRKEVMRARREENVRHMWRCGRRERVGREWWRRIERGGVRTESAVWRHMGGVRKKRGHRNDGRGGESRG